MGVGLGIGQPQPPMSPTTAAGVALAAVSDTTTPFANPGSQKVSTATTTASTTVLVNR
jgi:hypothetical protein